MATAVIGLEIKHFTLCLSKKSEDQVCSHSRLNMTCDC